MSKPGAAAPPLKLLGYVDYSTQRSKFKDQSGGETRRVGCPLSFAGACLPKDALALPHACT